MNKVIVSTIVLIGFLFTASAAHANKKWGKDILSEKLPVLAQGKARIFVGKTFMMQGKPSFLVKSKDPKISNYYYEKGWDTYTHAIVKKEHDRYVPFLKFILKTTHYSIEYYYIDVDAGKLELVTYGRHVPGFYTIRGKAGTYELEAEAGKSYQLLVGRQSNDRHGIQNVTLNEEQFQFCAGLKNHEGKRSDKLNALSESPLLMTNGDILACRTIVESISAKQPSKAFSSWVDDNQDGLQKMIKKVKQ